MAFMRLIAMVIVVELIFYVLIGIYIRSTRREALEHQWDARRPDLAGDTPQRRKFVRRAMVGFRKTLRSRLVGLVLVLPVVAMIVIIVLVNYN